MAVERAPRWTVLAVLSGLMVAGGAGAVVPGPAMEGSSTESPWPILDLPSRGGSGPVWLDEDLRVRLEAGQRVFIDEIEGFPYGSGDLEEHSEASDAEECLGVCPPLPYTHIRPGAALGVSQLACTANFVFHNGDRLGIGTAGHCTSVGREHSTLLVDPTGQLGTVRFGQTIYSINAGPGYDFALIEIDEAFHDQVSAAVAVIDGPCGAGGGFLGRPMQGYGHGLVWGAGGQTRHGLLMNNGTHGATYALAPGVSWGDSGSPAIYADTKEAAAVTTHALPMTPYAQGTTVVRALLHLEEGGHPGWELMDSPNCLL